MIFVVLTRYKQNNDANDNNKHNTTNKLVGLTLTHSAESLRQIQKGVA